MGMLLAQYCECNEVHQLQQDWVMVAIPRDSSVRITTSDKCILLTGRTFLVIQEFSQALPLNECHIIKVHIIGEALKLANFSIAQTSGILSEILRFIVQRKTLSTNRTIDTHLHAVLLHEMRAAPSVQLNLPLPKDIRAFRLYQRMLSENGLHLPLSELAKFSGASKRTIERIIQTELGMTFAHWRQTIRIQQAVHHLALGKSVTETALEVGYGSPSALIDTFRRHLKMSPTQFRYLLSNNK